MTQIIQPAIKAKNYHALKASLKIDMTPLVDLGFLLISFFIFTTSISEPTVTKLLMPADDIPGLLNQQAALTVLLTGQDSIYYYNGKWEEAIQNKSIGKSNYEVKTGIGNMIREKQKIMGERKNELMLLIKPLERSSYSNLMNTLDEVLINGVKKYAIVDATNEEISYVK